MPQSQSLFTPLDQPLYPSYGSSGRQPTQPSGGLFTPLDQPLYDAPTTQQSRPLNSLEQVVAGQPAQKPKEMSWTDWFITNGLRTGGAIGGGMLGAGSGLFTAGATSIPGAMLGAGAGATAGDILARKWMGEEDNVAASLTEGLVGGVTAPFGPARVGLGAGAKAVLGYGAKNAALGAGTETLALPFRIAANEGQWRMPTLSEGASTAGGGALFGGGLGLLHGAKTAYEPSLSWLSSPATRAPEVAARTNAALDAQMNQPVPYGRNLPEYYPHPTDLPPSYQQPKDNLFGYHDLEAPDELPALWRNEPGNPYGEDLPGLPTANNSLDKFLMQQGLNRNEFYSLPMDRQQALWRLYDVWQGQGQQAIPDGSARQTPGYAPSQQFTPPPPPSIVPPDGGGQGQRNLFDWEPPRTAGQMGFQFEPAEPPIPYDGSNQGELNFSHYIPRGGATGERTPIEDLRNQAPDSFSGRAGPIVGGPWQQGLGLSGVAEQTPYRSQMDPATLPPMSAFEPPSAPPPVMEAPPPVMEAPVKAADTPVPVQQVVVKPGETVAQLKWRTGIDWNAARALWAAAQVKAMAPVTTTTGGKTKKAPVATTPVVGKEMGHNHPFLAEDMTIAGDVATVHYPSAEINAWLRNNGFVPYAEGQPNQMIRQGGEPTKFIDPPVVTEKKKGTGSKFEQAMQARTGVPEGHVSVAPGEDIVVPNERAALKGFIDNMEKQFYRAFGKTPDGKSTIFRKFDPSEAASPAVTKTETAPVIRPKVMAQYTPEQVARAIAEIKEGIADARRLRQSALEAGDDALVERANKLMEKWRDQYETYGYNIFGKPKTQAQGLISRLMKDESGEFDPVTAWQNLKRLLGRDPTDIEMTRAEQRSVREGEITGRAAPFPRNRSKSDEMFKKANGVYPEEWERYQELSAMGVITNYRNIPEPEISNLRAEFRELHNKFPHVQNMAKIGDIQRVIDEAPPAPANRSDPLTWTRDGSAYISGEYRIYPDKKVAMKSGADEAVRKTGRWNLLKNGRLVRSGLLSEMQAKAQSLSTGIESELPKVEAAKKSDSEAGFIDFGQVGDAIGTVKRKLGVGMGNVPDKVPAKGEKKPKPTPNYAKEILALPSAAVTTGDLSFSGRQGLTQVFSMRFLKGVPKMLESLKRENYLTYQRELDNNPVHRKSYNPETGEWNPSLAERAKVKRLTVASEAGEHAENIASKWIETGGFLGPETVFGMKNYPRALYKNSIGVPIRATNRAYITMANHLSTTMLEELADDMANISIEGLTTGRGFMPGVMGGVKLPEFMGGKQIGFKQDYTPEEAMNINPYTNDKAAQELGDFINTALGMAPRKLEGVPWKGWKWDFERASGIMNATMFSPGLFFSRLRMLTPGTYVMASPYVRKQYLKSALSMAAAWYGITNIMKVASEAMGVDDVEINNDWTNSDFGKVRVGNTRMDPGGGSLQFLVAFGRMVHGGWTSSSNQEFHEFGKGINARTQFSNAFEFMANKLNPIAKFVLDISRASEYMPFHAGDRTMQLFTPLIIQDAIELASEDPDLLPWLAPISLGLGTQTYSRGESEGKLLSPENDWLIQGNEGLRGFLPSSYSRVER